MAISALDHGHELQRPSTEVQRDAVAQRGRVGDREVGVAGLGATVEQADRQAGARSRGGEELLAVVRVADRARRDRVDRLAPDPACGAEVGEDVQRRQCALDGLSAQASARGQALADAHRLVYLVDAPPPAGPRAEHDEPKRVGPQIDDREAFAGLHAGSVIRRRAAAGGPAAPGRAPMRSVEQLLRRGDDAQVLPHARDVQQALHLL